MDNLKNVGFKDVTDDNVLLRTDEASKEARRQDHPAKIPDRHSLWAITLTTIPTYLNENRSPTALPRSIRSKDLFGKRYILLPNAMYGTWENAIYDYGRLTDAQKAEKRVKHSIAIEKK